MKKDNLIIQADYQVPDYQEKFVKMVLINLVIHLIERIKKSRKSIKIIIATTNQKIDDPI